MSWRKIALRLGAALLLFGVCGCGTTSNLGVKINEIFAKSSVKEVDDWLELYNPTSQEVSLKGLQLKDVKSGIVWDFPDGTVIPAKGFLKIICDDSGKGGRTNFKLSSKGETITLQTKAGESIDSVTFPTLKEDTSWGRVTDGASKWQVFPSPSPGKSNQ